MGLRRVKRQIAKARLAAANYGKVNRKLHVAKNGVPLWRAVMLGKFGRESERVQMNYGKLLKARKDGAA